MKPFMDFLSTLSEDVLMDMSKDADLKAAQIRERLGSGADSIGTQVGVISYTYAIEILGCYHKWLEQQL